VGLERFIKDKLPFLRQFGTPVIVNMACETKDEFVKMTEILTETDGIGGLEINMCCPNVEGGGKTFSADPDVAFSVVKAVRNATDLTIIAKLLITGIDVTVLAKACEEAGADAINPGFGPMGMAIDIHTRRSKLGKNLAGALGGPALKSVGVRLVWQATQVAHIPVIGHGGITNAEDALEFFIAGATAVEIGAYNLVDPQVTIRTVEGIRKYLVDHEMSSLNDIRGSLITS
jgi:dihydroorotate dehydrogenase (NAD+) catalytic subunit